ncbi:tannase and feruloyl esterase [Marasmius fiardii PR-910]|nr:tannase and feruloyl esterase [Marasmius fiardii PR-910]
MQLSLFSALQLGSSFNFESACSLSSLTSIPFTQNTTLFQASIIPAGSTIQFPDTDPSCNRNPQIVSSDICRITMQVETSPSSNIRMEAWLPRNWTGRFLSTGNGGLGGCIQYPDLAYTTSLGFATVGANNGHNGSSGAAFENPEVLADFAFRSVHTNVVIGKQITQQFYGQAHKKSYYLGCSTGGREGLKSVQDFPEDFDGVVAGAPAANWVGLMDSCGHFFSEITGNSTQPTFIPLNLWATLIHDDVLSQCDEIDGVQDGIIEDPSLCHYDPSGLLCQNGATSNCLTPTQIETVRKTFKPFLASDGEAAIYPHYQPGAEALLSTSFLAGNVFQFTSDWFRFVVYNSSFDPTTLTLQDYELALKEDPFQISTFKGDLTSFDHRGGKLLTYHGQADGLISPLMSEIYYDHAQNVSGRLDSFYRFFRISGMSHCGGGAGAWQIGQTNLNGTSLDPGSNVLTAMVRWVEQGEAPETMEGVKYVNDDPAQGVAFQRRHCRYPLRNTYDGQGNPNVAESWSCKAV